MPPVTAYIVETFVTLIGVVLLAVAVLYGARRLGIGRQSGPLELLGRLPLDARRAVYLVRVGKVVYVIGASEGGLTRLGELDADAVPAAISFSGTGPPFSEVLGRVFAPSKAPRPPPPSPPGGGSTGSDV